MSFSADWLALREGADHRSRHHGLAAALSAHFSGRERLRIVDLGSGTGSNLRATAPLLPDEQEWTLVDYDPALLEAAALALHRWADEADAIGDDLVLIKGAKRIGIRFRLADLNRELDDVLAGKPDLVTASALFDLISDEWMTRFAAALRTTDAAFYTVLTYDGRDAFTPVHAADEAVIAAFAAHQQQDKGFGPAAGPRAAAALVEALSKAGYRVTTGDSPWQLGPDDAALAAPLIEGMAAAVAETGRVKPQELAEWKVFRLVHLADAKAIHLTGHTDVLAR